MVHSNLPEIKLRGEKLVEKWLMENNYSDVQQAAQISNEHCLKASGLVENILVQIRTFVHPNRPFKISDYETDILKRSAAKFNLVAYVAYVIIDRQGNSAEEINWERLI